MKKFLIIFALFFINFSFVFSHWNWPHIYTIEVLESEVKILEKKYLENKTKENFEELLLYKEILEEKKKIRFFINIFLYTFSILFFAWLFIFFYKIVKNIFLG